MQMLMHLDDLAPFELAPDQIAPGPRWLTNLQANGGGVFAVTLAYGPSEWPQPDVQWIALQTSRREATPDSFFALLMLMNYTAPHSSERAGRRYERAAMSRLTEAMNDSTEWQTVRWHVNGAAVDALFFRFAGAWAGFLELGDVALSVFATDQIEPTLAMQSLADSTEYGFDSSAAMEWPEVITSACMSTWGHRQTRGPGWPRHPDHDLILG